MHQLESKMRIYCAGPLFNDIEQQEMKAIAEALENAGYDTFLPQRDGLELANLLECAKKKNISHEEASILLSKAIFSLDIYQVTSCDGLVLNMNGRTPDEGAIVEAGVAWASDKKIVIYKNDKRSFMNGQDNPMVVGLSCFQTVKSYNEIAQKFQQLFHDSTSNPTQNNTHCLVPNFNDFIENGKRLFLELKSAKTNELEKNTEKVAEKLFDLIIKTFNASL
jgi:nucleoside 2-deoxyribosyltransferase